MALYNAREYAGALAKFERALELCRKLHKGADNVEQVILLNNAASCLEELGRWDEALPRRQAALAACQRICQGQDHPAVANGLRSLAWCLDALGRPAEALPKYEAALAMRQRLHKGKDDPHVEACLNDLGLFLLNAGRAADALPRLQAALAMARRMYKPQDHPAIARGLHNLASCLEALGRPADALGNYQAAVAMRKRIYQERDHPDVATGLNSLAGCLIALGRAGEALGDLRAVLAMRQRLARQRDHPLVARSLNNVGFCLQALGRPAEALPQLQAAQRMFQRLYKDRDHPDVATGLSNVASCLKDLRRFAEALPKYQAALRMRQRIHGGQDHPDLARCLSNVAVCLEFLGRPDEALPKYQAAVAMARRLHKDQDHPDVAAGLYNMGSCLADLKRPTEALATLRAALGMAERLHSADAFKPASGLGHLYLSDLDRPAEAAKAFDKAIAGMELARVQVGGHDLDRAAYFAHLRRWGAFEGMIRAQLRLHRPDKALEYVERGRALSLRDVLERGQRLQGGDLLGTVEAAARQRGDDPLVREVARARKQQADGLGQVAALTAAIRLVRGRRDLSEEQRGERIRKLNAELAKARQAHLSARRVVFNLAATHAAHDLKALTADQIQRLLSARQRLLIYTIGERDAVLLLLPPAAGRARSYVLKWPDGRPVKAAALSKAVDDYVSGMMREGKLARGVQRLATSRPSPAEHTALGRRLFQALVPAELWAEVKSAEQLYLVPDAALHRLPFEALIAEEPASAAAPAKDRRYWLDVGPPLVYGPSATVLLNRKKARDEQLARLARGTSYRHEAVLLGDPIFHRGASSGPGAKPLAGGEAPQAPGPRPPMARRGGYRSRYGALTPLPGTRQEVLRIYRTLVGRDYRQGAADKRVAVLLGEDATRTRLFAEAAGCRYLHLATHGLMDASHSAIYSSLALTQPRVPTPEDFGFLTLVDLFDNWWGRLGATELVVLSACDTQRGRMESGEGVFGISWGFLYAGSPAVIASLWQVADESTAQMMGRLYGEISRRQATGKPSAKLGAFVAVRKALREKYPEPFFWAPFIYIGDPR